MQHAKMKYGQSIYYMKFKDLMEEFSSNQFQPWITAYRGDENPQPIDVSVQLWEITESFCYPSDLLDFLTPYFKGLTKTQIEYITHFRNAFLYEDKYKNHSDQNI